MKLRKVLAMTVLTMASMMCITACGNKEAESSGIKVETTTNADSEQTSSSEEALNGGDVEMEVVEVTETADIVIIDCNLFEANLDKTTNSIHIIPDILRSSEPEMTIENIDQALFDKMCEAYEYVNILPGTVVNGKSIDRKFLTMCSELNSGKDVDAASMIADLDLMITVAAENKAILDKLNTWTGEEILGVNYCSDFSIIVPGEEIGGDINCFINPTTKEVIAYGDYRDDSGEYAEFGDIVKYCEITNEAVWAKVQAILDAGIDVRYDLQEAFAELFLRDFENINTNEVDFITRADDLLNSFNN